MINNIYMYPLFFCVFFWKIKDKLNRPLYIIISLLFVIASIAACYTAYLPDFIYLPKSNIGVVYHILCLSALLLAFKDIDKISDKPLQIRNTLVINALSYLTIFFNIIVIVNDIGKVEIQMILADVASVRAGLDDGEFNDVIYKWMDYPYFIGRCYWMVAIALAFYHIVCTPQRKFLIYSLLFSSSSMLIYGFKIASRDCMLCYFFVFIMLYISVRKNIITSWSRKLKGLLTVGGGLALAFFILVTFLRFFYMQENSRNELGTIGYLGQGMVNFQSAFLLYPNSLTHGTAKFPFFVGSAISRYRMNDFVNSSLNLNVFYTVIGSWVMDVGIWITIIVVTIYNRVIKYVTTLSKSPFTLIYLALAFHFAFYMIFYQVTSMSGTLIAVYLFVILLDILTKKSAITI